MTLGGLRDLSIIATPPAERLAVKTFVGEWHERQIRDAVLRELRRGGQVYFVHNRVENIESVADELETLLPEASVRVAHGQMSERALEEVMLDFYHRRFNVLVCTTIIESGLDVPNANTLVVERADLLGLAQLYQLRGRVGRSTERGYAYLFFPEHRSMTEEAYKRLETISTHTGLGSGLSIALRDLEIRGAGNIVGADQSGHVASIGFDAYAQLMREAVDDLRSGGRLAPREPEVELKIDLPVDAHLPHDYIADEALRLEAYRKIAAVRDAAGVKAVREELVDRYGALPPPAERLMAVAALRAAVRRWGIHEITTTPRRTVRVTPVSLSDAQEVRLQREHPRALYNAAAEALELPLPRSIDEDLVGWLARQLRSVFAPHRRGGPGRPPGGG
jgi:transcription-repair coupling factor (superfamily II helicase)